MNSQSCRPITCIHVIYHNVTTRSSVRGHHHRRRHRPWLGLALGFGLRSTSAISCHCRSSSVAVLLRLCCHTLDLSIAPPRNGRSPSLAPPRRHAAQGSQGQGGPGRAPYPRALLLALEDRYCRFPNLTHHASLFSPSSLTVEVCNF
jgi:hypothetical protein